MLSRSSLLFLFALFCLTNSQVSVLILDAFDPDVTYAVNTQNVIRSATGVADVEYTYASASQTTYDSSELLAFDLVFLVSKAFEFDQVSLFEAIVEYATAGGAVLVSANSNISLNQLYQLVGTENYGDCYLYSAVSTYWRADYAATLSSAEACAPMMSGFRDVAGERLDLYQYFQLARSVLNQPFYCLDMDTADDSVTDCLVFDDTYNTPAGMFTVKEFAGEGKVFFWGMPGLVTPEDDIDTNQMLFTGFYYTFYNNLLVSLGATAIPEGTPDLTILKLESYYNKDSSLLTASLPSAVVIEGSSTDLSRAYIGSYDMIVLDESILPNSESIMFLKQYAYNGGVVLLTGNYDDGVASELLGQMVDCAELVRDDSDNEAYIADLEFSVLPADNDMCAPLLQGFEDIRGNDPADLSRYTALTVGSDAICLDLTVDQEAASCLSSSLDDEKGLWPVRYYGGKGGLITHLTTTNENFGDYIFNMDLYRTVLLNLEFYAGNQNKCSAENSCVYLPIDNGVEWQTYSSGCIAWFPHTFPATETTVTLSLVSGEERQLIVANLDVNETKYEWPRVFGITVGNAVHIEFSFAASDPMVSAEFQLVGPLTGEPNPCVGPIEEEYYWSDPHD